MIRKEFLPEWTETEIRLRICKLLRYYDLSDYKDHKFTCEEEIIQEAKKNRKEAERLDADEVQRAKGKCQKEADAHRIVKPKDPKLVGGIYFNPPPLSVVNKEHEGSGTVNVMSNFFANSSKLKIEKKEEEVKNVEDQDENQE